jgi:hypothetical protein
MAKCFGLPASVVTLCSPLLADIANSGFTAATVFAAKLGAAFLLVAASGIISLLIGHPVVFGCTAPCELAVKQSVTSSDAKACLLINSLFAPLSPLNFWRRLPRKNMWRRFGFACPCDEHAVRCASTAALVNKSCAVSSQMPFKSLAARGLLNAFPNFDGTNCRVATSFLDKLDALNLRKSLRRFVLKKPECRARLSLNLGSAICIGCDSLTIASSQLR